MITKVLIAEDHESVNISLQKTLEELAITDIAHAYYCDDALYRITQAVKAERSFDLLITDLSFAQDDHKQLLSGGTELIAAAREVQPDLKILVFSLESRQVVIDLLYNKYDVDGFVLKARNDVQSLKEAINEIARHRRYYPNHIRQLNNKKNAYSFSEFDITIITLLAQGMLQKDIPAHLQLNGIKPSGLSSIEKRLNQMKDALGFTKNEQLVAHCKDLGAI
ncbi:response regulator [Chitinophaga ginsengisegetis]|uniref:response regulator n=1 Tax=Chitinophaga ginsengisegetis TaxID=393003 RepID=UPI000DB92EB4|nr:response regulator [Chitinophaga ginsengisegetis]MDR6569257.1 DNA-binding NarL/FixJ family response regulator [Chitinophaga ginsengisegetis]MDR6648713.1 DNA-binding NarL/FixJ family response regulator [Chitinophaga ginsengisegetis]MDR6655339.1 DNA-binding NarL/FixJ family response regulator [Chitinophaga ginsengisegetis]